MMIEINNLKEKNTEDYVWIWVKVPYSKDMNKYPSTELRKYKVKERKKTCIILCNGKQYPYSQCFASVEDAKEQK